MIVRPDTPVACSRCAAGRGCGAGLGSRKVEDLTMQLEPGFTPPDVGERVALTMASGSLLRAAAIVYGWPLLGAVGMAVAGSQLSTSDATLALFAISGLVAGFLVARWQASRHCLMPSVSVL
jgi:sigma-E factor negative regulatory protein RseC